jgi:hypothetical protein
MKAGLAVLVWFHVLSGLFLDLVVAVAVASAARTNGRD